MSSGKRPVSAPPSGGRKGNPRGGRKKDDVRGAASGGRTQGGGKGPDAMGMGGGGAAQVDDLGRVAAMGAAGAATFGEAGGGARTRALAAMEAAAAVRHRWLATGGAGPRAGAAARGGQEIAGGVAVVEPAAGEKRFPAGSLDRDRPFDVIDRKGASLDYWDGEP